jgi:hypothetical protein
MKSKQPKLEFFPYPDKRPTDGENVLWVWSEAGQICAGDYLQQGGVGVARDASRNYETITEVLPTHWCRWPVNWPSKKIYHHAPHPFHRNKLLENELSRIHGHGPWTKLS